ARGVVHSDRRDKICLRSASRFCLAQEDQRVVGSIGRKDLVRGRARSAEQISAAWWRAIQSPPAHSRASSALVDSTMGSPMMPDNQK
ncbi:hypothetical protein ABTA92_20165, partial [Acinetobacter baumannii]